MKKHIVYLVAFTFLLSCFNKEKDETKLLMAEILDKKFISDDAILVSSEAFSGWLETTKFKRCKKENFTELQNKASYPYPKGNKIIDIFSDEDIQKICTQGTISLEFQQEWFPDKVKLISQKEIDDIYKYKDDHITHTDNIISGERLFDLQTTYYYRFSNPVFLQDYQYAFVYVFSSSLAKNSGSSSLFFYEKKGNKWELIISIPLTMA